MARNCCYIMLHINDQFDIMGGKKKHFFALFETSKLSVKYEATARDVGSVEHKGVVYSTMSLPH